jgi:hypothetical protein
MALEGHRSRSESTGGRRAIPVALRSSQRPPVPYEIPRARSGGIAAPGKLAAGVCPNGPEKSSCPSATPGRPVSTAVYEICVRSLRLRPDIISMPVRSSLVRTHLENTEILPVGCPRTVGTSGFTVGDSHRLRAVRAEIVAYRPLCFLVIRSCLARSFCLCDRAAACKDCDGRHFQ